MQLQSHLVIYARWRPESVKENKTKSFANNKPIVAHSFEKMLKLFIRCVEIAII